MNPAGQRGVFDAATWGQSEGRIPVSKHLLAPRCCLFLLSPFGDFLLAEAGVERSPVLGHLGTPEVSS